MLRMFFTERIVDTLRLAVAPDLRVDDAAAPRLDIGTGYLAAPHTGRFFGSTFVTTYELRRGLTARDEEYLRQAIDESRKCVPSATSYRVGAVVVTRSGACFAGHTHETSPTHHAEPESCSAMMLRLGFARAVFAAYEPDCFVQCRGALDLRLGGVEVRAVPAMAGEVLRINSHLRGE